MQPEAVASPQDATRRKIFMENAILIINGKRYIRVYLRQAETFYNAGITVTLYPCNYGDGYYQTLSAYHINKEIHGDFRTALHWYESEYCYDSDTGKTAHCYIETMQEA